MRGVDISHVHWDLLHGRMTDKRSSGVLRTAGADVSVCQHEAPLAVDDETRAGADSGLVILEGANDADLQCHNCTPHGVNNVMPTALHQHILTKSACHGDL